MAAGTKNFILSSLCWNRQVWVQVECVAASTQKLMSLAATDFDIYQDRQKIFGGRVFFLKKTGGRQ